MKPLDLMKALYDLPEDLIEMPSGIEEDHSESPVRGEGRAANAQAAPAAQADTDAPAGKRFGYTILPYLLTAGCTAACIAGFGLMIRFSMGNEIVGTQSEIPISVQESVSSMTTAVSTGERAVLTAITETHTVQQTVTVTAEDRTEPVSVTETDAVTEPAAAMTAMQTETAAAKTQTEPLPLTGTTAAETQPETTAPEPPAPVYEMGDVDMDGKITYSDLLSALIIDNFSNRRHQELSPFTESQAFLADVNSNGCVDSDDTAIIGQYLRLTQYLQLEVSLSEVAAQSEEIVETIDRLIKESENEENPKNLNLGKQITDAYIKISAYVGKTVYDENCRNGIPAEFWSAEEPLTWEQLSTIIEDAKTWRWVPVE